MGKRCPRAASEQRYVVVVLGHPAIAASPILYATFLVALLPVLSVSDVL